MWQKQGKIPSICTHADRLTSCTSLRTIWIEKQKALATCVFADKWSRKLKIGVTFLIRICLRRLTVSFLKNMTICCRGKQACCCVKTANAK